jgi:hypothetical protein
MDNKMKMNFFQFIWYAFKRLLHKISKKIVPDPILTPLQQDVFDIFKLYLNDNDNVKYLEPNSERKYIVSKDYVLNRDMNTLFILLDSRKISIIKNNKHDFDNKFDIPEETIDKMNKMFKEKVEQDRQEMRGDIMKSIKSNMELILEDLKKKNNDQKMD